MLDVAVSRNVVISVSPQGRAYTRALNEKVISLALPPKMEGAMVTNNLCIRKVVDFTTDMAHLLLHEPCHEKTCLPDFQPGPIQTGLDNILHILMTWVI